MEQVTEDVERLHSIMELSKSDDEAVLSQRIHAVSTSLGFELFLFAARFLLDGSRTEERVITNIPATWVSDYRAKSYLDVDPTMAHASGSLVPLLWRARLFQTERQKALHRDALSIGLCTGGSFPVHAREGDFGVLNLGRSDTGRDARSHAVRSMLWGPLLAAAVHQSMRVLIKGRAFGERSRFTEREIEVLKWLVAGKSSWDISGVMGISEHGVIHHVRNIMRKLDVPTRRQAVVKAIALGLT
jgi:LuxR family transcriptional regulator, quorum-sensing system regulator LasR